MREAFGCEPSWLLWLRYSTFLVLYPIGFLSEVGLIFVAMPSMKTSGKYCLRMPNKWNFTFDYFYASAVLTALYALGYTGLTDLLYTKSCRTKVDGHLVDVDLSQADLLDTGFPYLFRYMLAKRKKVLLAAKTA